MIRNLLPRLRSAPTPANISPGTAGAWSTITDPSELSKIEYEREDAQQELRTRIQSIPSPWARMLLFRAALDDPAHPARRLVESEILDVLEFVWSLSHIPGVSVEYSRLDRSQLPELGRRTGSRRAADVAHALEELVPRSGSRRGQAEVNTLTLALVDGKPVFASSPYTILFTAEDAAENTGVPGFFDYAANGERRRLCDRPPAFQEYVARVIRPQLYASGPHIQAEASWGGLQGRVRPWLEKELKQCVASAADEQARARLSRPAESEEEAWKRTAEQLGLELASGQRFGGILLYQQAPGSEFARSPLRLEARRSVDRAPLVIIQDQFEGSYYHGAQAVALPHDLQPLDRTKLPGLGIRYPWVSPVDDWLTRRLVLLSEPIERDHVYGYGAYRWRGTGNDPRFSEPHMLLPLRSEFFEYFRPEDVDEMLSIDVHPDGRIAVTLVIPLADDRLTVRRTYSEDEILNEHGPSLNLWPSFEDEDWPEYILFRRDMAQAVAQQFAIRGHTGGVPVAATGQERRTPLVELTVFDRAPEALELRSTLPTPGSEPESVGVILPRYRPCAARGPERWDVGVDFGTSNTVVSIRGDDSKVRVFGAEELTLPLTEASEDTLNLTDAYFFPAEITPEPFGTAVVYHESLRNYELGEEPIGLRVNVPFTGEVDGYHSNAVKGDLKWSADPHAHFLSASFLRHVLATVLAQAIERGVDPARITFRWAYPRAFSQSQLNNLRRHWKDVLQEFAEVGVRPDALADPLDESQSVLRHFFNLNLVHAAGDLKAVVDVGGGTSDIAMYGDGRVLALDSVVLGGRNLTGSRPQAGDAGSGNPFVTRFFAWARENGLPDENRKVAQTYLDRDQVHLAFSYLVGTRWFQEGRGRVFTGQEIFHDFQTLVFYFFASLFYYLGVSLRSLPPREGGLELPATILVAGNGSRYLDWLTDLVPNAGTENVFTRALGRVLAAGALVESPDRLPRIKRSEAPKQEVARGLVARVGPGDLPSDDARTTPVVGESVTLSLGDAGETRSFDVADRFDSRDVIEAQHVHGMRWDGDRLEVERFHDILLTVVESVAAYGDQWGRAERLYRDFFDGFRRSEIQSLVEGRLQFLAQLEKGFRGSLFLLEATVVLEEMRDRLFRE